MTSANVGKRDEKFLFNVNVFDAEVPDDLEAVEENLPPPPPTYSQAELDAAKTKSFEEGKALADAEAKASRAQFLANVLANISKEMTKLFDSEDLREASYEFEAVRLTERVFAHVYPLYAEATGFDELKGALRQIIKAHNGSGHVRVSVHPDMTEGVEGFLAKLSELNPDLRFSVKGEERLGPGACALSWDHGGAVRDTEAMAVEIQRILKEALAARGAKGHDEESNSQSAEDDKGDAP
jgi:flagellar assembly protein FliH